MGTGKGAVKMKVVKAYSVRPLSGFMVNDDSGVTLWGDKLRTGDFVVLDEGGSFVSVIPAADFAKNYRVRKARTKKVAGDRESGGE
jgi:hypothetical protein